MMLSIVVHDPTIKSLFSLNIFWTVLSFLCMYACAAFINDIADVAIDRINLKGHKDRPLVTGAITTKSMIGFAFITATMAIAFALVVGLPVAEIVAIGIVLNIAYSVKPLRISYRPFITPFYLAFCYVGVPFAVGYFISGAGVVQWMYFAAFYFLFLGRISLKDLRDRKGDAAVGKPTLVLLHGKKAVVALSTTAISVGTLFLITKSDVEFIGVAILFWASLAIVEYKLLTAKTELLELLSVGYGARMGNGLLFALFGSFLLISQGASANDIVLFYTLVIAVYGWMFVVYVRTPQLFRFGTRQVKTA